MQDIVVMLYKWAGQWGPFRVKIPCGECTLTEDIIFDTITHDLSGLPIRFSCDNWLDLWWRPLMHGGWHPPIVLVNNVLISQGVALNKGTLVQAIMENYAVMLPVKGNHVYGKETCVYCRRAKKILEDKKVEFHYHDVIRDSASLYEMLGRVKPIIGHKTPVTVPQIWIEGNYVGGAKELSKLLQ